MNSSNAAETTDPMRMPRLRLRITPAAERALRSGHPWVYGDSVREQNREAEAGELGVIYDRQDRFLAIGLYDPNSPIRLRVLEVGSPVTLDHKWWSDRISRALERRRGQFDPATTGYRLIHGESDGWPGLVLDRYDTTLVVKCYTAIWLSRLAELRELITGMLKPERLVLRLSRNIQAAGSKAAGVADGQVLLGPPLDGPVVFQETGLRFEADVVRGQKTGFFLDQRENRREVERLAQGRRVLNAFSFSGGFSLYAARGGATSVVDIDISSHALAGAKRNFELNQADARIACCRHEAIQADAFEWLTANPRARFDLIVLDPPAFAQRETQRATAVRAYERLSALGLKCLSKGGILLAASCSAHVTADEFFGAVHRAAKKTRRAYQELRSTRHPLDHPATFAEAEYSKAIYLKVD